MWSPCFFFADQMCGLQRTSHLLWRRQFLLLLSYMKRHWRSSSINRNITVYTYRLNIMSTLSRLPNFDGKGNVNRFLNRVELFIKEKNLKGEEAAQILASRLDEPAFNVYMHLPSKEKNDVEMIKRELRQRYDRKKRKEKSLWSKMSHIFRFHWNSDDQ